ncbi:hypothetical protein TSMEX_006352, partial [Taenia solium]
SSAVTTFSFGCAATAMLYLHTPTQTIFSVCSGVPLAILGVGANCFNLYLFHQDNVTSIATRLLLVSVSISETIFLALSAIYCTAKICHFKNFAHMLCSALLFYLLNVLELVRNWLLVLLGIERLLHFEFRLIWSRKTVALAVALITGFACLVRLPSLIYNLHDEAKEGNTGAEYVLPTYSRPGGYQDSQEAILPNKDTLVELLSGFFAKTERFTNN